MGLIKITQLVVAIALILVILLQNKGAGAGGLFGGSNNVFLAKRGLDKTLFVLTIILTSIFFAVSILTALF